MMWRYGILKTRTGSHFDSSGEVVYEYTYGLHEIYEDDTYTTDGVSLDGYDSAQELIEELQLMLKDASKFKVLDKTIPPISAVAGHDSGCALERWNPEYDPPDCTCV